MGADKRLRRFIESDFDTEVLLEGLPSDQVRMLEEGCVRCGHVQTLLLERPEGMVCVECITRENGEDGEPGE